MSDQLTGEPAAEAPPAGRRHLSGPVAAVVQAVTIIALFAAVGALAGVVWEWLWTPPSGIAYQGTWTVGSIDGLREEFSGTGLYVVVGLAAGVLTGLGVGLIWSRRELLTLAATVVGSGLGAWLMREVGLALGPPDPAKVAATAEDLTDIPGQLVLSGSSALIALPVGALLALAVLFLGFSRRPRTPDETPSAG